MVLPIREICLPFSAKKEKFPFLPRSSRTEKYVFHFRQKKKNFRFWCEWDLISTSYSNETTQSKCQKKKKSGKKKGRKKKDKKVPCPPQTPLLSTSHDRSLPTSLSLRLLVSLDIILIRCASICKYAILAKYIIDRLTPMPRTLLNSITQMSIRLKL